MGITLKTSGSFKQTKKYMQASIDITQLKSDEIQKIAEETVEKLAKVSPYESIAVAWSYEIKKNKNSYFLYFNNSYVNNGVNIALLVDKGHATKSGKWIEGKNYIDGPIDEAYKQIIEAAKEELNNI